MTRFAAILTTALLLASSIAAAKSIEDRKWVQMESPNFTIYSTLSRGPTEELLRRLEIVHALFFGVADERPASRVPTSIFAVKSASDLEALGWDTDRFRGLFVSGIRRNIILVRSSGDGDEFETIVHEYVHYLLHSTSRFPFPAWYHEGYAEYISKSEISPTNINIGRKDKWHLTNLSQERWLPWEDVLDSARLQSLERQDRRMFYAQAWLLVHYLYSRPDGTQHVVDSMKRYGTLLQEGADEITAFEDAFGMTMEELEDTLRSYERRGRFHFVRLPVAPLLTDFEPVESPVSRGAIAVEMGTMLARVERYNTFSKEERLDAARRLFDVAASDQESMARAEMGIGRILAQSGDPDGAEEWIISAASLAANDPHVQLDAASYYLDRAADGDTEAVKSAEPYLRRASQIDNTSPEFAFTLGRYLLMTGESERGIRALETAARLAPADNSTRFVLAQAYADNGQRDVAIRYAKELLVFAVDSSYFRRDVMRLIRRLESEGHETERPVSN